MSLIDFVRWLNGTSWSVYLRESDYPFGIIESFHILALGLSVGIVVWLDLRLMGLVMRRHSVSDVVGQLEPVAKCGFAVMVLSGSLLLLAEPMKCYNAISFRLKVVMLILAAVNVLVFHIIVYKNVTAWDKAEITPWGAKIVGFVSILLWLGIIIAGRWTAYL
jgi:hypothetical protein